MLFPFYAGLEFQEQRLKSLFSIRVRGSLSDVAAIKAIDSGFVSIMGRSRGTISHRSRLTRGTMISLAHVQEEVFLTFRVYLSDTFPSRAAIKSLQTISTI